MTVTHKTVNEAPVPYILDFVVITMFILFIKLHKKSIRYETKRSFSGRVTRESSYISPKFVASVRASFPGICDSFKIIFWYFRDHVFLKTLGDFDFLREPIPYVKCTPLLTRMNSGVA